MLVLNDIQIIGRCQSGMVEPFDKEMVNPASIDIRIGDRLLIRRRRLTLKGWEGYWQQVDISATTKEKPCWVKPETRFLTESLETFNIPTDLVAQFRLKSSRGRELWEHLEAGFIDPGWHGSKLTMEVINHDLVARPIWKGMRFGQIYFMKTTPPIDCYGKTGRYNGDQGVQVSKG